MTEKELGGMIDHTLLKIQTSRADIEKLCEEAIRYHFASVAINPVNVPLAAKLLRGTDVKVDAATGFFLGAYPIEFKVFENKDALEKGADELDMVMNVGALKSGNYDLVKREMEAFVKVAGDRITKIILETALLTDEEKVKACRIAKEAGVKFVKTSTGFGPSGGATVHDVKLMRKTVGEDMRVKASGGIRTTEDALAMIEAGANRLGTSSGVKIVKGLEKS
ncbi:MAG: deoxyribose-phosphate aldolase [Candidatus Aerophobetes bacterium]|nr:deoxyribose-phosphate aldolase [Candidatus Aerophobetes bacterium]